jgi:arsenate reductase-like glutaredoxin family protein
MSVAIFHNPACGTSRNTLALIRHAGIERERRRMTPTSALAERPLFRRPLPALVNDF